MRVPWLGTMFSKRRKNVPFASYASTEFIACDSLPPATITSVPVYDFAIANEGPAAYLATEHLTRFCSCDACTPSVSMEI